MQGGFRMDYYPSGKDIITLQGDFYGGSENDSVAHTNTNGQNVLGRFTHHFSDQSNLTIRTYFDRTWRTTPNSASPFFYELNTYDFDVQHRFSLGSKQSILWGGAYRLQKDRTARVFVPLDRDMPLYSGFVQDEIMFVPDRIKLTIGSKFLNNVFSGFETQPSARMAWTPNSHNTVWAAVSRAVRIPTRFDSDITVTAKKFGSEKVNAYELGYRVRPVDQLSLSFATFYNQYRDLRSLDSASSPSPPIILANSQRAESWGFEISGNFQATNWWRLRGGFTYFDKNISPASRKVLPISSSFEGVDPRNICMLQSVMNLPYNIQLDLLGRYTSVLPPVSTGIAGVPSYFTFDVRLAWQVKSFEIAFVGQNLWENQHTEVGLSKIPRSVYGKISCRF